MMADIRKQIEWLHEAKRGLGYPTQSQYNELWHTMEKMHAALEQISRHFGSAEQCREIALLALTVLPELKDE